MLPTNSPVLYSYGVPSPSPAMPLPNYLPPHYPAYGREPPAPNGCGPEPAYSRPESVSTPARYPTETQYPPVQAVNGAVYDGVYFLST